MAKMTYRTRLLGHTVHVSAAGVLLLKETAPFKNTRLYIYANQKSIYYSCCQTPSHFICIALWYITGVACNIIASIKWVYITLAFKPMFLYCWPLHVYHTHQTVLGTTNYLLYSSVLVSNSSNKLSQMHLIYYHGFPMDLFSYLKKTAVFLSGLVFFDLLSLSFCGQPKFLADNQIVMSFTPYRERWASDTFWTRRLSLIFFKIYLQHLYLYFLDSINF